MTFPSPPGTSLVRELGVGSVFALAVVRRADRECLCKRLRLRMVEEPAALAALEREAQALRLVRHRSVPELIERGADEWGHFLLQSWRSGVTLRELVAASRKRGHSVPSRLVRHVVVVAFQALAELHTAAGEGGPLELVHGDLGPDHVLVDPDDGITFVDFGQARWRGMGLEPDRAERGTLPYVAPEVARGAAEPDQANDVYALAATMAFLVLQRDPCVATTAAGRLVEVSEQGLDTAALEQSGGLRPSARKALVAALRFDPAGRARTAADVLRLLRARR